MTTVNIIVEAAAYNAATNRISSALQLLRDEMKTLRHQDLTLMRQLITINDSIKSLGQDQRTHHRTASSQHRTASTQHRTASSSTQHRTTSAAKRARNRTRQIAQIAAVTPLTTTTPCSKRPTPLVRQQSLPRYFEAIPEVHERRGSMSSEEDSQDDSSLGGSLTSLDDDTDTDSVSAAIPVFQQPPAVLRQRSRSMLVGNAAHPEQHADADDANFETILNKNVQLWKAGRQQEEEEGDCDSVFDNDSDSDRS